MNSIPTMNRRERFLAAVGGRAVDRPPTVAWVHFLSDHLPGDETARLHLEFLRAYNWDVAKLMNDYRYPVPHGLELLDSAEAMRRFKPLSLDERSFAEQLRAIECLRRELGPEWPILDTLFDPCQQVLRNVGFNQAVALPQHRDAALEMLDAVTDTLCRYVAAARNAGADGFFLSINGAIQSGFPRGGDADTFRDFQRPFDLRLLDAAKGTVRVLHVHGVGLDLDRVIDYPCEVFSVSDRLQGNPSLAELRRRTDRCLMGGLDESRLHDRTLPEVRAEVDDALAQAGRERLILAPGCTLPSFSPQRTLQNLREYTLTI
ncbi:MAG: uroporphyrinogen decarboxylase family protein [Betaproteobacteria bacterium]